MDQQCQDKIPFRTKAEAEGASVLARYRYGSGKHKIYKCKHCEMWHLARDFNHNEEDLSEKN